MMSWRRGFFRLWLVTSALWLLSWTLILQPWLLIPDLLRWSAESPIADAAPIKPRFEGEPVRKKVTDPALIERLNADPLSPEQADAIQNAKQRVATGGLVAFTGVAFTPPIAILLLGSALAWVLAGFASGRRKPD